MHLRESFQKQQRRDTAPEPMASRMSPKTPMALKMKPQEPMVLKMNPQEPMAFTMNPQEPMASTMNPQTPTAKTDGPQLAVDPHHGLSDAEAARLLSRTDVRLLPMLFLVYVVAFLDR